MPNGLKLVMVFLCAWPGAHGLYAATSGPIERDHVTVELISEVAHVQPGTPFRVGLYMQHDDDWHTYWVNPGDSGLETRLSFALPEGAAADDIEWPFPQRIEIGHLVNYGYEGEHLLPVTITPSAELDTGTPFRIELRADWLICEVECIPGDVDAVLELPVESAPPLPAEAQQARFERLDRRLPEPVEWPARFATDGGYLSVEVVTDGRFAQVDDIQFFAAAANLVAHAGVTEMRLDGGHLHISQPLNTFFAGDPESLEFTLVAPGGQAVNVSAETAGPDGMGLVEMPVTAGVSVMTALLMALVGGMLLNLMPCVFPVLSLKALSLVEGAGDDGAARRSHALAYTAGVLISFGIVAGLLLVLRAGGEAIGWGFQLQSPWFVGGLAYVMFALALSLSGLVQFGTGIMGAGQSLTEHGGCRGSFFTGVLACVVASPCTAPFMGVALGFAVTQPWPVAMIVFLGLGLGLALPMLLLGLLPALARWLPRPGAWMETFKQAMAFPLYLTVVWLLWVLARQTDANGMTAVLTGLVVLAFVLWLWGRGQVHRTRFPELRDAAGALGMIAALALLAIPVQGERDEDPADAWWESYSPERLQALRATGEHAVFVNMTADWCVTCLVNERVALNTNAVRQLMEQDGVVYMKGDWTRRDPVITEMLAQFDRNGVPLYVLYPPGADSNPWVLPQILTPGLVLEALDTL